MLQIRQGVFETNSSSTHSIVITTKDEFDKWVDDEVYLNAGWWSKDNNNPAKDKTFITKDEAIRLICDENEYICLDGFRLENDYNTINNLEPDKLSKVINEFGVFAFDDYPDEWLEYFEKSYTTTGGETIVAFGCYGHD